MLPVTFNRRFRTPLAARLGFDPFDAFGRFIDSPMSDSLLSDAVGAAVDIHEDDNNFYIDVDVPGFSRDDIDVTFEDGMLTISGERKSEEKRDGENYHVTERRMGRFSRSFRLTNTVNENSVEARLADGVLTVQLAKADEVKPRRIEVKNR